MSEVVTTTTEVVKPAANSKPMTDSDFLASRIAKIKAEAPKPKADPEPEPKKTETNSEASHKEGATESEKLTKAVLSKDVDELTDEEISELAEKGKSGLLRRVAELTAKRKLAEERAASLEAALAAKAQPAEPRLENNPYAEIKDVQALAAKKSEVDDVIEWAEEVLDRADGVPADEVVATVDGRQYTKVAIKDTLRKARKARDKFLPSQLRAIQEDQNNVQLEQMFKQQARKELPWMEDEASDVRKRFDAMSADPRLKKLRVSVPELAPQIDYLVAHAANSMFGRRSIPHDAPKALPGKSASLTPPSNPQTSAAAPERAEGRDDEKTREVESRFKKTGRADDFIALRAAQISKRKTLK